MSESPVYSHPLLVARVPEEGATFHLAPDAVERERLARALGIVALPALTADITVTPDGRGGVDVGGRVRGTVRQDCVVTLEPFDAPLDEAIDMHFVPEGRIPEIRPGAEIEVGDEDIPDMIENGAIDLGAILTEFLALGIDPYPRKPGVVFEPPTEGSAEEISPFGALAKLRKPGADGSE